MKDSSSPGFWTETVDGRKALVMIFPDKTTLSYYRDNREIGTVRLTDAEMIDLAQNLTKEDADAHRQ